MTATNICYNFVGFRCSPPTKAQHLHESADFVFFWLYVVVIQQEKNNDIDLQSSSIFNNFDLQYTTAG